ncbi:homeobox-leucine zipper protein ROC8 [Forsythia ovata]|uniref:Homeobox-leucine zipper protein ROC8 n=1 Tax=Forsythia ovata TaxID=205694 RepID=A0ABD1UBF4_9LAMI
MDSGSGSNSQISNPKEESKRPQEELSQTNNSPDQEHREKWSKEMALEKKVQEKQAENSALRMANARIHLDNLKMSQKLENRRCPTCMKSSSLERLQIENAILREEPFAPKDNKMLMLQETSMDSLGAMIIYTPIELQSITSTMNGEDITKIPILPSGYVISSDGSLD